jgi:xylulose-5-phosphate/fructose-6-phosphate phosphoketolase
MLHGRANEARFHVRGFRDAGTTTTPFDMVVLNGISRFDIAKLALKYVPRLRSQTSDVIDMFDLKLYEHRSYIRQNFEDLAEIADWYWTPDFTQPTSPAPLAVGQPRAALFTDS